MEFKFDSNLPYQSEAVNNIINLFKGQNRINRYFSMYSGQRSLGSDGRGIGNLLELSDDELLANLNKIQDDNNFSITKSFSGTPIFDIEMETGTGKTYVYLRSIFELNKHYDFTKFIIVVPSLAIKEGVYKTINITKKHFKELYNKEPNAFIYDKKTLEIDIPEFLESSNIQIMIINIQAFNKDANIIRKSYDKFNSAAPIDLIAKTCPIVIIDEPQSVLGSAKSKSKKESSSRKAIDSLMPLCRFQYSATHRDKNAKIFKLGPVEAAEQKLVKKISVAGIKPEDQHNYPYIRLVSCNDKPSVSLEMDFVKNGKITRKLKSGITINSKLDEITGNSIYKKYTVKDINFEKGYEEVTFYEKPDRLTKNKPIGYASELELKRLQIRQTIFQHLNKELELLGKGIKVLSLFFIDKVSNYRSTIEGPKGIYAQIFEEEYSKLIKNPFYAPLLQEYDIKDPEKAHKGYFSIDKQIFQDTNGSNDKLDSQTYDLIMKNKEKLLSFNEKTRFIFSHSALREGWDNPNVFQICTLNETNETIKKRQEIGRGLRLCVNQNGERVFDDNINVLTIMANESYDEFARNLQQEIEEDTGFKFGIIEPNSFEDLCYVNESGIIKKVGKQSRTIYDSFILNGYINRKGKVQEKLKEAVSTGELVVPPRFEDIKNDIIEKVKSLNKSIPIYNANEKKKVTLNKELFNSTFQIFWDKIKHKTYYSVDFNSKEFIGECISALNKKINVPIPKFIYTKADLKFSVKEIGTIEKVYDLIESNNDEIALPDIITFLQEETFLTRKAIVEILKNTRSFNQFRKNPYEFMEQSANIINEVLNEFKLSNITYHISGEFYDAQIFYDNDGKSFLDDMLYESQNLNSALFDYVKCDSKFEKGFAKRLDEDENVILYTKLPDGFKIPTPIGNYIPDWAIIRKDVYGKEKLYFVVETKANLKTIRDHEQNKIDCAELHFKILDQPDLIFTATDNYRKFKTKDYSNWI